MNKAIQYREDGKFYGLVNVPAEPRKFDYQSGGTGYSDDAYLDHTYYEDMDVYKYLLKACIEAGKEIINPEVINSYGKGVFYWNGKELKPGEIFDCPENIEFEEDQFCAHHNLNCSYCGTCAGSCYKPKKVIRLKLKQEVKQVESQDATKELLLYINDLEIRTADEPLDDDEFIELIKSKFTIQRNKNI